MSSAVESAVRFGPHWEGVQGIYGGFVIARLVEAARLGNGFRPLSATVHFVSGVQPGDARMVTRVRHRGRSTASVAVELHQERARAYAVVELGAPGAAPHWHHRVDMSQLPEPESIVLSEPSYGRLAYSEFIDMRLIRPGSLAAGATAWTRLDPRVAGELDGTSPALSTLCLDALPPGLFGESTRPVFVPTIEFSIHFWPMEADLVAGWHYATQHTVWASDEFCLEESTLYSRDGRVVAHARQTRGVRWSLPGTDR
ncbi:acyl-CoA thioesterase [Dactylosporangium sucinum]|uniref:acyl-CoA thioesterase n=1 Tax=Dactylosporangium sucinum TaxID=1424081 RepID=UPI00167E699C|nr:thioesterase family protein [Dactylosporangium sucinum]